MSGSSDVSRRRFGALAGGAFASLLLGGGAAMAGSGQAVRGRLSVRPEESSAFPDPGTRPLGLDAPRDAIVRIPPHDSKAPLPLLVLLHGAGGRGESILGRLGDAAAGAGLAVLAPDSRASTWDVIRGGFGPDVTFLNRALARVFETVPVDPRRLSIGGFSDGATYALSIGLINGDLFSRVIAFSPGFFYGSRLVGRPDVFVSHGTADAVLSIDRGSRRIVRALRERGYDVTYREFEGGHTVPEAIAREGMRLAARAG